MPQVARGVKSTVILAEGKGLWRRGLKRASFPVPPGDPIAGMMMYEEEYDVSGGIVSVHL